MNDTTLSFLESPSAFLSWLKTAQPGDSFVYYTGFLADRETPPPPHEIAEGEAALRAFSEGRVELAQKRIKRGEGNKAGTFQYIAQKRRVCQTPKVYGEPWRMRFRNPLEELSYINGYCSGRTCANLIITSETSCGSSPKSSGKGRAPPSLKWRYCALANGRSFSGN
jgi:hypothetical protein